MTVDEIRRENLKAVTREPGGIARLARALEISESQLSQWILGLKDSKTGKPRGMRPASCRRIEEVLGKPSGWLDAKHGAAEHDHDGAVFVTAEERPLVLSYLQGLRDKREGRPASTVIRTVPDATEATAPRQIPRTGPLILSSRRPNKATKATEKEQGHGGRKNR